MLALLSEKSIVDAAEKCGLAERTLRRWLSEPGFRAEYDAARRAAFDAGMSRIQALTAKAVDTLDSLLDATITDAVRLGAARTITELGVHQHDAEHILRKLDEIEARHARGR